MKSRKGFSLVELLIVIGIIAVLGGVMLTQFSGSTDSALAASCLNNMRTVCNAVMADASKSTHYPSAGPFQYFLSGSTKQNWHQGWIGYAKGNHPISSYYPAGDAGEDQHYAITNGTIWRSINGQRSAYVCPAHAKHCKRNTKLGTPAWSFAMNSYFGWDYGKKVVGEMDDGMRGFGSGYFWFKYTSAPKDRKRPIEKVLLFAEIPYVDNGTQEPATSITETDMILQYTPDSGESKKADKTADSGGGEAIGFNHKSGQKYLAHVAFADGHCVKLMLPQDANESNLKELTTWLCTGQEYIFNGAKYQKVTE